MSFIPGFKRKLIVMILEPSQVEPKGEAGGMAAPGQGGTMLLKLQATEVKY